MRYRLVIETKDLPAGLIGAGYGIKDQLFDPTNWARLTIDVLPEGDGIEAKR